MNIPRKSGAVFWVDFVSLQFFLSIKKCQNYDTLCNKFKQNNCNLEFTHSSVEKHSAIAGINQILSVQEHNFHSICEYDQHHDKTSNDSMQ